MTVTMHIDVDNAAFLAALPAAIEEWQLDSYMFIDDVADKVVTRAQVLVAKRTTKLEHTIHREPLVKTARGAYVQIVAGDGTRYAIYQEFGTSKMRAHPYMRPALAMAAGAMRSAGYSAQMVGTSRTRAATKRAAHRAKLRRAVRAGMLTPAQARMESKRISRIRRFRGQ